MDEFVAPDHPTHDLLFFAAGAVDDRVRESCDALIGRLSALREWVIGPPEYVDTQTGGAKPTVGGMLKLFSSRQPWSLPRAVELRHFAEVSTLLEQLEALSAKEGIPFGVEYDGEFIGEVRSGELDRGLRDVFLGEWKRHLNNT